MLSGYANEKDSAASKPVPIPRVFLNSDEKIQYRFFLSALLNLVNDEKLKSKSSPRKLSGKSGSSNAIKISNNGGSNDRFFEKSSKGLKMMGSKDERKDIGSSISVLEHSLNELEKHNQHLTKENISLREKLRGVEETNGLEEDPNWASGFKSSGHLSSLSSPFFKANSEVRKKSVFYRKGSREGTTYSDQVIIKLQQGQKRQDLYQKLEHLETENQELLTRNRTYESEINELYSRIDKFDTLESSVAEMMQENERLRQIVMRITGQLQHNF